MAENLDVRGNDLMIQICPEDEENNCIVKDRIKIDCT